MFFGLFKRKKKPEVNIQRSQYFPDKLYTNKLVKVDPSVKLFLKKSNVNISTDMFVTDINTFAIDGDVFEETHLTGNYGLLYDVTNETFYLMQRNSKDLYGELMRNDSITIAGNEYLSITTVMETSKRELYRIYSRMISSEADEYLFVTLDSKMVESYWLAIILQPGLIK